MICKLVYIVMKFEIQNKESPFYHNLSGSCFECILIL